MLTRCQKPPLYEVDHVFAIVMDSIHPLMTADELRYFRLWCKIAWQFGAVCPVNRWIRHYRWESREFAGRRLRPNHEVFYYVKHQSFTRDTQWPCHACSLSSVDIIWRASAKPSAPLWLHTTVDNLLLKLLMLSVAQQAPVFVLDKWCNDVSLWLWIYM